MRFAISKARLPVTALLLALCARPAAAQQGEVTGRVTDKTSGTALATAQVSVVGTTIRALTGQDGRSRLVNVPAGPATLRVSYIGYATTTQEVSVPAGGSAQADFAIAQAAVGLEAIVVTATGDQAVREQGTAAHTVDLRDRTSQAAVSNLSDALNSTVPGVVVQGSGGTTGTGTRVRIRGSNSVSLSNDPVLIVDGIRVENSSNSTSIGVGGQQPSRLNDLSPQDLEAVQVNSGPASSVLYGTDAANGAIVMRTRRGQPGATKWTMSAEGGTLNDYGNYPDNYTGLTSLDSACALTRVVATLNPCVQVRVRRFNPIEQRSPFRTGHRVQYGISASGGSEQTTFYLAGHFNNEDGVYPVNWNKQVNLLANLFDHVRSNMDIQATALYTNGKLRLPQNDNNVFGVLSSGFLGGSDSTVNNGYGFLSPAQSFSISYVPKHRSLHGQPAGELPAVDLARSARGDRDGFPEPLRREHHIPRGDPGVVQRECQPGQPQREPVPDLQLDREFLCDGVVRADAHAELHDERRPPLLPPAQPRRACRRATIDCGDEFPIWRRHSVRQRADPRDGHYRQPGERGAEARADQ